MSDFLLENISGEMSRQAEGRRRPKEGEKGRTEAIQAAKDRAAKLITPEEIRRRESLKRWREGGE